MPLGKKICPNCKTEIGARTKLCDCGWYFPEGELKKHLLKAKKIPEKNKTYTSEGKGRKRCPGCQLIIGGVTKTCFSCGFDFSAAKKERDEKKEAEKKEKDKNKEAKTEQGEKISPQIAKLLMEEKPYEAPKKLTPKDNAMRILGYGKDRAISLWKMSKMSHWGHVDWDVVEKGLNDPLTVYPEEKNIPGGDDPFNVPEDTLIEDIQA